MEHALDGQFVVVQRRPVYGEDRSCLRAAEKQYLPTAPRHPRRRLPRLRSTHCLDHDRRPAFPWRQRAHSRDLLI
jgi:hypothetical protein